MRMVGCGKIRVFLLSLGWILINTAIAHNVHVSLATIDAGISPKASAISTLKNDKDADVRSYFNPPPSLSTCGESTAEYFDSDGEPIGDVSVSV